MSIPTPAAVVSYETIMGSTGERGTAGESAIADVIGVLREEHHNIAKLLGALERQLARFMTGGSADLDIIEGVARYFIDYPDLCHHPKEDAVFRRLRRRDPASVPGLGNLEKEHEKIGALSRAFADTVHNVLQETVVPRLAFEKTTRDFIDAQRRHMEMEERSFFPAALNALTDGDWAEVTAEIGRRDDPLFGSAVETRFRAIAGDILDWDRDEMVG